MSIQYTADIYDYLGDITQAIDDSIFVIDKDYKITFANNTAHRLFGSDSSLTNRRCYEFLHRLSSPCQENYKFKPCPHKEILLTGKAVISTHPFVLTNGETRVFNITASPVKNNYGEVVQVVKVLKDITELKKVESLIENQEILFSSIFESMQDGMIVVNKDFRIIYANKSYIGQTGLPYNDIKGRHCYEISHHNTVPCYMAGEECSVKNAFETGYSNKIIHTHVDRNNNPVYVETSAYPIRDVSGNITSVAERVSDTTERLKLDEELRKRVIELEDFYEIAVGRELRMIELKEEIENLKAELIKYRL